ncbi:conserved oligomeric Golgi complex subunit 1 [Iris pallida]|uniref:Conserved oligomeric Golgi complex subunit 1 n=1 Tax=Iris pallida TaxID=29817 RepID=A0AAX6H4C9_IRIPA|nr:conserved oligomeric Golgi complex subunit 1 [Iris pallida]
MVNRDAESLFRTKPISVIRSIESDTKKQIDSKKEELRLLVGASYRDLIDSADSIISMRNSCTSISSNLSAIESAIQTLDPQQNPNPNSSSSSRSKIYGLACRVKYLVDTPENIWGTLEESMLLEASGRYFRAKQVHDIVVAGSETDIIHRFPLLKHQWQIVESFRSQISQKSRERLADRGLGARSYADALAAAATVDDLSPAQVLLLLLDSRRSWISQRLSDLDSAVFCDVVRMIRTSLGQVGEMFLLALNEMPLFYKMVLGSPPGSQLFGGIPNPDEEVRLWKSHREKLESVMVVLEPEFVAETCCSWLRSCCDEIFGELADGKRLMDLVKSGKELASAEKLVWETLDGREGLEGSLEQWLRSVFGSEIESPWNQIRGLILKEGKDILEDRLEDAFIARMKEIVQFRFHGLKKDINVRDSVETIVVGPNNENDFYSYLKKPSTGGGVWFSELHHKKTPLGFSINPTGENNFRNCLNVYFGSEVSHIKDAMDAKCGNILEDLLCFVESRNSTLRLKDMAPYIQYICYKTVSVILQELEDELGRLSASLESNVGEMDSLPPSVIVERSLFIGRLLFALRNHSTQIPLILGSPRQWVKESSGTTFANLASPKSKQPKGSFDSPISLVLEDLHLIVLEAPEGNS